MFTAHRKSPPEDCALGKALRFESRLGVDFFIHPGDRHKDRWPYFLQQLRQVLNERAVRERHPVIEHREIDVPGGDMAERQKRNADQPWAHVESQQRALDVRSDVAVREHRAL